jgi:hypothetical protein
MRKEAMNRAFGACSSRDPNSAAGLAWFEFEDARSMLVSCSAFVDYCSPRPLAPLSPSSRAQPRIRHKHVTVP